jgi:hypothetical protein
MSLGNNISLSPASFGHGSNFRKFKIFKIDTLGDHLCTCTSHSGAKKAHDWAVDQLADLSRTTHKVKTQQVVKSRGQHCGDLELAAYLAAFGECGRTGPVGSRPSNCS